MGPSLAQQMQLPQVTNVRELQPDGESLLIHRQTTQGEEVLRCALPALVTVSATPYAFRMPTVRGKLQARKKEIPILDETCMDVDLDRCGLRGSPTRVIQTATKSVQVAAPGSRTARRAARPSSWHSCWPGWARQGRGCDR